MPEKEVDELIWINCVGVQGVFISLIYSVPFYEFPSLLDACSSLLCCVSFCFSPRR